MAFILTYENPAANPNNIRIPLAAAPEVTLANQIADAHLAGNGTFVAQNFPTLMMNLQSSGKGLHPSQMTSDNRGRAMRSLLCHYGWAHCIGAVPNVNGAPMIPLEAWQVAVWA
jgi:hypothetical protein